MPLGHIDRGGRRYIYFSHENTKKRAQTTAKKIRNTGRYARVEKRKVAYYGDKMKSRYVVYGTRVKRGA